jgi:hypothetical protein
MKRLTAAALALSLCACSSLIKPSDSQLAALPVVTYPDKPAPNSEYVYKLPAGEPLAMRVISEGSAFSETSEQMTAAGPATTVKRGTMAASLSISIWPSAFPLTKPPAPAKCA